jgi:predicted unusual protein kinase regulating ubiquinone biosynthesis (AarF/ABC1/UbiB family)
VNASHSHVYFCISYIPTYSYSYSDKFEERSAQRGEELAKLLTKLGPTFIKVGQSLSIRTDLLSPGYVRGLQSLQDQVPPFYTKAAREILEAEGGRP